MSTTDDAVYEGTAAAQGGVGFVSQYTGASGTVPIGDDPEDGERFTGVRNVIVYVEITHLSDE